VLHKYVSGGFKDISAQKALQRTNRWMHKNGVTSWSIS
jgi:hypothetical protein